MIVLILPTWGRSGTHLPRLLSSLQKTADRPSQVRMVAVVSEQDRGTRALLERRPAVTLSFQEEDPKGPHLARLMNQGWRAWRDDEESSQDDILMYLGDDFEFVTKGWDTMALRDVQDSDGWCLVTGPDGYLSNDLCPTFFFVHRKVVDAVGSFVWPDARKEGTDAAWGQTMRPMGLVLWDDRLLIEHRHSTREGCAADDTFRRLAAQPAPVYGKEFNEYVRRSQERLAAAIKMEEERSVR